MVMNTEETKAYLQEKGALALFEQLTAQLIIHQPGTLLLVLIKKIQNNILLSYWNP
jgi:hypothetical protein